MLHIKLRRALVIIAAMFAMLALGPYPASACCGGTGIWTYNHEWSIALVNLTDFPLTYLKTEEGAAPYPIWHNTYSCIKNDVYQDMLDAGDDWQVDAYRTKVWVGDPCSFVTPSYWDGRMTLYLVGHPECSFDLVFVGHQAHNLAEHGNYTGLSPSPNEPGPGGGWVLNVSNWAYGRWVTPVNDYQMHNVMTLISSKFMVALYSGDNNNLVVVVQQLYGEDPSTGDLLWDDSNVYKAYHLDFVDNDNYAVPH